MAMGPQKGIKVFKSSLEVDSTLDDLQGVV